MFVVFVGAWPIGQLDNLWLELCEMNTKYIPMKTSRLPTGAVPLGKVAMGKEETLDLLPVDPQLLERANWWFDVSWYGLLWAGLVTAMAAFATVAFLFLQFWSSGVRERQSDWRTSSLEVQSKRADADLA
jgi:hypothetical protein